MSLWFSRLTAKLLVRHACLFLLAINNQSFLECDNINIIQRGPRPASRRGQMLDFMSLPRLQIGAASQASPEPRSALSTTRKVPLQRKSTHFFGIKTQLETFTFFSSLYNNTLSLHHTCRDHGSVRNEMVCVALPPFVVTTRFQR